MRNVYGSKLCWNLNQILLDQFFDKFHSKYTKNGMSKSAWAVEKYNRNEIPLLFENCFQLKFSFQLKLEKIERNKIFHYNEKCLLRKIERLFPVHSIWTNGQWSLYHLSSHFLLCNLNMNFLKVISGFVIHTRSIHKNPFTFWYSFILLMATFLISVGN